MRRSRIIAFAVVASWCAAVAAACGLDEGGTLVGESPDGSLPSDGATLDGQIIDGTTGDSPIVSGDGAPTDGASGPDGTTVFDAGKPYLCATIPVGNCVTDCPGFPDLCGTLCIGSCSLCVGNTFQCDACFSDGGHSTTVCEPQDAAAFASCLAGFSRCPCTNQSNCPGDNQTCTSSLCFECGEPDADNLNQGCKNGSGGKQCKTDPVHYGECN